MVDIKMDSADIYAVVGESARIEVGEAINYIKSGQAEIGEAVQEGIASFDSNATQKTTAFNTNAGNRLSEYNSNADNKLEAYNNNASAKVSAFNQNASDKTDAFNGNATSKTGDFNDNATSKTTDFNTNATNKTTAFNNNASEKQAAVDASALAASQSATEAKQWAIGDPSEPTGNSAKYWAEQSAAELSGLTARVSTIEGKIPSAASSSNQLVAKSYVDTEDNNLQSQIDAITAASDVTDVVGTYAQLQAYDTSTLPPNSIIKVLQDESQNDETTYYRWVITGGVGAWVLIGEEGPYYTKSETNTLLSAKQDTLVSGTNIKTINGSSVLGSGDLSVTAQIAWGSISGTLSNQTDLQNALNAKQGTLTFDSTPTSGSSNPVTSGGIYTALSAKANDSAVVKLTGNQTIADVKTFSSSPILPTPTTSDNSTKGATTAFVVNVLKAIYPVGAVYIGTTSTCPLASFFGTWTLKSSGIVTSVNTSVPIAGNGMTIGLTNGTTNYGMSTDGSSTAILTGVDTLYGTNVGTTRTSGGPAKNKTMGLTTDATKSGLTGTVTRSTYTVNIWERTA